MKGKILKGFLVASSSIILLTGVGFASEVNDKYFKIQPFEDFKSEYEGKIERECLDEIEKAYDEAYQLEKKMKYFKADEKWEELDEDELEEILEEKDLTPREMSEQEDALEELCDDIGDINGNRDYRYGLPSFDQAYELELKDYINSISKDKREPFKKAIEAKYEEMEAAYEEFIEVIEYKDDKENRNKYEKKKKVFYNKRKEIKNLMKIAAKNQKYLIFIEDEIYSIDSIGEMEPEKFNLFLNQVSDFISKEDIGKLRNLNREAYEADNDIDADDLFDEIEEILYDYYYDKNNSDMIKINELYEEIDEK